MPLAQLNPRWSHATGGRHDGAVAPFAPDLLGLLPTDETLDRRAIYQAHQPRSRSGPGGAIWDTCRM